MNRTAGVEAPARTIQFEDAALVAQVQAGDVHAYAHLVSKYQDRVFNACWRICGSPEDAADVTQDAFVKALESIGSFRGASGFYTWLFRIAVNQARSYRRRGALRRHQSLDRADDDTLPPEPTARPEGPDAGDQMDAVVVQSRLEAALQALDEPYRVAVVLRDVAGFDYDQIADVLEVPKGTVKSRIARGRAILREALAPYMEPDA